MLDEQTSVSAAGKSAEGQKQTYSAAQGFRTIQVCPKDLPGIMWQAAAVEWWHAPSQRIAAAVSDRAGRRLLDGIPLA
jgi:hypothetical protein